jgi:hypothetical protein
MQLGRPARPKGSSNIVNSAGHALPHFQMRLGAAAARGAGLAAAALLCQSLFWWPAAPLILKIVVAGFAVLAAFRPDVGMLILAGVAPFGRLISAALSPAGSLGVTEALALAYLVGWFWHRLHPRAGDEPEPLGPWFGYLFAAVVVASLLVEIGIYRYWRDYWPPFLRQLFVYFSRDYLNVPVEFRPWARSFGGLASAVTAARFLEGVAIAYAVHALYARDRAFGPRLLLVLAVAAVGTAMVSVWVALQVASAESRSLLSVLQSDRIAGHVTKVNTAASSFVLFIPIVVGLGPWSTTGGRPAPAVRAAWWAAIAAASGLLLTALWMTSGRTALLAGLIVIALGLLHLMTETGLKRMTWKTAAAVLLVGSVAAAVLGFRFYMRTAALEAASLTSWSLPVRLLMWRAALTTLAARPLFGVGIGQFQYQVAAFAPGADQLTTDSFNRFNAHNQFLEVAAELGLVGGVLFVGMFAVILWRAWRAFRSSHDAALGGAIAGVVAFLITCLAGQPLLYDVVAFPFWMVLGVVLAGGETAESAVPGVRQPGSRRLASRMIAGFLIALTLSIPVRVWRGQDQVNFALASYGFSRWQYPDYGRPYRLVRDDGTFFTYPNARGLTLPVRRDVEAGRNRLDVEVFIDGQRARTLTLTNDEWQTVELMIPADASRRFRRVDLAVRAPAGVTAQVRVAHAEVAVDKTPEQGRAR